MNATELFFVGFATLCLFTWAMLMNTLGRLYQGKHVDKPLIDLTFQLVCIWIFPLIGGLIEMFSKDGFIYGYLLPPKERLKQD